VTLKAGLLANHIAVLAGSGSGKTVFLRRIIEEAALLGIPSIVLIPTMICPALAMPGQNAPPPGARRTRIRPTPIARAPTS